MTTLASRPVDLGSVRVTQLGVIRSEWIKLRSVRSTWFSLLAAVVIVVGLGTLFSALRAHRLGQDVGPNGHIIGIDPTLISLRGVFLAQLAIGVLGVLVITGEYSTGMIRSSLTAVPRRLPVLWAKLAVFAGSIFSISLVASFISFFLGQSLLSSHHLDVTLSAPGALRSVIGAALFVTVAGMIGVALGALFRNTAAGIATFAGVFFVIPPLSQLLPASIGTHLTPYLPSSAGEALWGGARDVSGALSPWTGFALLCGYAVVLIAAAAWRLRRADA